MQINVGINHIHIMETVGKVRLYPMLFHARRDDRE